MENSSGRRINYCIEWLLNNDADGSAIICIENLKPLSLEFPCISKGKDQPVTSQV
jgi:hypothetical protein